MRALNARRAAAYKRDRRGQRNLTIARGTRHLAGVVVPTIAGRPNGIAVGALPFNLELALGACAVRKCEIRRDGLGRIARSVAYGNLLGSAVKKFLDPGFVPSNLHRLVGLIVFGFVAA